MKVTTDKEFHTYLNVAMKIETRKEADDFIRGLCSASILTHGLRNLDRAKDIARELVRAHSLMFARVIQERVMYLFSNERRVFSHDIDVGCCGITMSQLGEMADSWKDKYAASSYMVPNLWD